MKKKLISIITLITMLCGSAVYAHSGRTDSSGGHRDNKNKSGLGSYHYHCGGYPAHLHPNGVCPYKSTNTSTNTSSNRNTTSSSTGSTSSSSSTTYHSSNNTYHSNNTYYAPPKRTRKMYTSIYNGEINGAVTPLHNILGEKEYYVTLNNLYQAGYDINVVNEWNTIYVTKGNRIPQSYEYYPEYKGIYCGDVVDPNYAIRLVGNGFNYSVDFVCTKDSNTAYIPLSELKCFGIR